MSKRLTTLQAIIANALVLGTFLSACGTGAESEPPTPTLSVDVVQTHAVATFSLGLTQTALAMPTETSTATLTPTATETSTPVSSATAGTPIGIVPTSSCFGMAFVSDVTIPDNTNMDQGQKFTKTWRVKNNGTCAWESGFKFSFTGGEAMGGAALVLDKSVAPGAETDLSVLLTAPNKPGTFRGNWRMANANGNLFGDEVYVLIKVGGTPAATVTAPSPTPTVTPTQTVEPTASS